MLVTELAVIVFPNGRARLIEKAPGIAVDQVVEATDAELEIADDVPCMQL